MEDQPTLPQATTPTLKSDVRTIDKQSDLEETPMPPENKHCHGWLIPITINQISTMKERQLYETLQAVQPLKLKKDEDLRLEVIGGGAAPTLCTATVQIGIAGGS